MAYPHDDFWYVVKIIDGEKKYLTVNGWGREFWTKKFPGAKMPKDHAESAAERYGANSIYSANGDEPYGKEPKRCTI